MIKNKKNVYIIDYIDHFDFKLSRYALKRLLNLLT